MRLRKEGDKSVSTPNNLCWGLVFLYMPTLSTLLYPEAGVTSQESNSDDFVKSRETPFSVIPAEAGIQSFQIVINCLDSGFHRSDDFLRSRQFYGRPFYPPLDHAKLKEIKRG